MSRNAWKNPWGKEPSANLIRAFIGASTEELQEVTEVCEDKDERRKIIGYGMPFADVHPWAYSNISWLLAEEEIEEDKLHLYKVHLPEFFFSTKGKRGMVIALAYDPPVRSSRREYLSRTMQFEAIQGQTDEKIRLLKAKLENDEEITEQLKDKQISLVPPKTHLQWSTLQVRRNVWTRRKSPKIESIDDDSDPVFHILVKCQKRFETGSGTNQKYALAVKIWHEDTDIRLHEALRTRVNIKVPVRVRPRRG